jgi:hypothetical protein
MAEYRTKPNIVKIGIINPKSFNIYRTEWFTKDPKNKGRIAKLKTLSFKKSCCVSLDEDDVRSLYNNIPRRKTINRWPSAKGRLKTLIDNYCK